MHQPIQTPRARSAALPSAPATLATTVRQLSATTASKPTRAVKPFDPETTLIRMPELLAITGLGGRATVYKLLKDDPSFPKPVPLTGGTSRNAPIAWVLAEVQDWIRARIAARGSAA